MDGKGCGSDLFYDTVLEWVMNLSHDNLR